MEPIFSTEIVRRNPFRVREVPWIARVYRYPFARWRSPNRQILFGSPHLLLFSLYRRLVPWPARGTFDLTLPGGTRTLAMDCRNSQFQALYRGDFENGYEPELMALFDFLISDDAVFYDVGSNWGFFSLLAASRPGFKGRVHAFEPFPSSHADLRSMVSQAGLESTITPHAIALSDQEGAGSMKLPDFTHSGLATLDGGDAAGGIRVRRLDSLSFEPPTVMKVDAEGSEAAILRGGLELIRKSRPHLVFENMRQADAPEATLEPFRILRSAGYRFFQPCWLKSGPGGDLLCPADGADRPGKTERLALVPLVPEARMLGQDQINVFACHESRWESLQARLVSKTLAPT